MITQDTRLLLQPWTNVEQPATANNCSAWSDLSDDRFGVMISDPRSASIKALEDHESDCENGGRSCRKILRERFLNSVSRE